MKKKEKRICKYKGCSYYSPKAESYCCGACSADAYDDARLAREEREKEMSDKNDMFCEHCGRIIGVQKHFDNCPNREGKEMEDAKFVSAKFHCPDLGKDIDIPDGAINFYEVGTRIHFSFECKCGARHSVVANSRKENHTEKE